MPDYTITLTAQEDLLLSRLLERANAERALQRDDAGQPLAPLTAAEFLLQHLRGDLQNVRQELQQNTQELLTLLLPLTATQRNAILNQLPSGPRKLWLQARLQQGA
jgi:hypothetical protein